MVELDILSVENNLTPLKLWVRGQFENASTSVTDNTVPEDFGIDWDGPTPVEDRDGAINIPNTECILNENQINELNQRVCVTGLSRATTTPWEGVRCYQEVKQFVQNHVQSNSE